MNEWMVEIAQRRAVLVARAAAQREEIGRLVRPWQASFALADRGLALLRRLRGHPLLLTLGVALLARFGSGRLGVWAGRIWTAWQLYRSLQRLR